MHSATNMSYLIDATDLQKSFGNVRAVDGVTLKVEPGEIYGLVGSDGAGKTTTMRLIVGALGADTIGAAIIHAGYDRSFELLPAENIQVSLPPERPLDPSAVILADEETRTICLPAGVQLDLGGVAKGWAAQQAMERLLSQGPALMNAAGDIAIGGSLPHGEPWQVAVDDPFHPGEELLRLHVEACGVATSGKDRRRWRQNGQLRHHIIDPRSGLPAESDVLTATVIAPTVTEAEAAAKVCVILGSQAGLTWLDDRPGLAALFILEDGQLICNTRMQEYL